MKVVVIGSGGREHAIGWKLSQSSRVDQIISCPGNGGLSRLGPCWRDTSLQDSDALLQRLCREQVDLVVIGPEGPLVEGLSDRLHGAGIPAFGPDASASRLEGSKVFAKEFMHRYDIPTARFCVVRSPHELAAALGRFPESVVVKADGLAAGKGVSVCPDHNDAREVALAMLAGNSFGDAGRTVLIEEALQGVEMTLLALVSGTRWLSLPLAQDYKALQDGNEGPNTGGMGAYSPTHLLPEEIQERIRRELIEPTLGGLEAEGIVFRGLLYFGIMLTAKGPCILEYNVRFGDPETQPILLRMKTDLVEVLEAVEQGTIDRQVVDWDERTALCLVLASDGYPGSYEMGHPIEGDLLSSPHDDVQVFHAGTDCRDDKFFTAGGRVLGVTALGPDLHTAREVAYERAARIHFRGKTFRHDIGGHVVSLHG